MDSLLRETSLRERSSVFYDWSEISNWKNLIDTFNCGEVVRWRKVLAARKTMTPPIRLYREGVGRAAGGVRARKMLCYYYLLDRIDSEAVDTLFNYDPFAGNGVDTEAVTGSDVEPVIYQIPSHLDTSLIQKSLGVSLGGSI